MLVSSKFGIEETHQVSVAWNVKCRDEQRYFILLYCHFIYSVQSCIVTTSFHLPVCYIYYFMITSKDKVQTLNVINFKMLTFSYACYSHHGKVAFLISVINGLTI